MKKICIHCGEIYKGYTRNKFCNRKCYFSSNQFRKMIIKNGDKTVHIIKGRIKNNGYWMLYAPENPNAKKTAPQGYVYEHRLVMEQILGRYLIEAEIIHHKNHIKTDNRPQNLLLTTRKEHMGIHTVIRNKKGQFLTIT